MWSNPFPEDAMAAPPRDHRRRDLVSDAPTTGNIVDSMMGPYVESPADPFVERMEEETDDFDRVLLASRALRHDPGCIDAHLLLAACAPSEARRLRHLEIAVRTGEGLWKPYAASMGDDMCWWGFFGTRPYMRAIHALGLAYLEVGKEDRARRCFERLLRMNPHDNQGVRFSMERLEGAAAPRM
jgi:hypothetical protein